jgi:hypothetical protein
MRSQRTIAYVACLVLLAVLLQVLAIITHVAYNDSEWTAVFHILSTTCMILTTMIKNEELVC